MTDDTLRRKVERQIREKSNESIAHGHCSGDRENATCICGFETVCETDAVAVALEMVQEYQRQINGLHIDLADEVHEATLAERKTNRVIIEQLKHENKQAVLAERERLGSVICPSCRAEFRPAADAIRKPRAEPPRDERCSVCGSITKNVREERGGRMHIARVECPGLFHDQPKEPADV